MSEANDNIVPPALNGGARDVISDTDPFLTSDGSYPFDFSSTAPLLNTDSNSNGNAIPIITSPESSKTARSSRTTLNPDSYYPYHPAQGSDPNLDAIYTLSNYQKNQKKAQSGSVRPISDSPIDMLLANSSKVLEPQPVAVTNSEHLQLANGTFKKPRPKAKGSQATQSAKRPAFVVKLWNMVNDEHNSEFISWMPDGNSFRVEDREGFMKSVLPKYFKHNNFASFVRQLNMYGWHKVQDLNSGSLAQNEETLQFLNPNFKKGREDLLDKIIRNKPRDPEDEEVDIKQLLSQLEIMRNNQQLIAEDLRRVRQDNEMLWKENFLAREKHKLQSETLDKILRFLASVYGNNTSKLLDQVNQSGVLDLVPQQSQLSQRNKHIPTDYKNWYNSALSPTISDLNTDIQETLANRPPSQSTNPNKVPLMITQRAHRSFSSSPSSRPKISEHTGFSSAQSDVSDSSVQELQRVTDANSYNLSPHFGGPLPELNSKASNNMKIPIKEYNSTPSQPNTPELLIGNINQHLDDNDSAINQVNEWITKYSKPTDAKDTNSNLSDDFKVDDFLQQSLDMNPDQNSLDLNGEQQPLDLDNDAFLQQTPISSYQEESPAISASSSSKRLSDSQALPSKRQRKN